MKDLGDSRKNAAKQEVGKLTGRRQRDKKKRRPERSPSTSIDSTAGVVTSTTTTNANTVTRETVSKANILPNLARTPLPRISTAIASEISQQPSPRTLRMKLSPSSVNIDSSKPSRFFAEEKAEVVKEEATENQSSKSAIYFDMNYLSEDKIKSDVHIPTKIKLTEIAAVSKINDDLMIRPTPSLSPANSSREMNILIGKYEAQIESLQHHRDIDRRMIDALQTELALSKQTADRTERALNQQVSDERRQQQSLRTEFESQLRDIERVRSALQSKLQLAEADVIRYKSEGSQLQQQHQLEIDATRQSEERYNSLLAIGNSIHIASTPTTVPLVDYQSLKDTLQQQEQEHRTELQALARERASWRAKHQSLSAEYERAEELNEELRIQIQKLLTARPISINNSTDNNHNNHNSGVRDPASTEPIESNINSTERDKIRERERQSLQIDFEVQLFLASSEVKTMAVRIADLEQQVCIYHMYVFVC